MAFSRVFGWNDRLDFFDASINRVAAWIIGTRSVIKALLVALLEPIGNVPPAEAESASYQSQDVPVMIAGLT